MSVLTHDINIPYEWQLLLMSMPTMYVIERDICSLEAQNIYPCTSSFALRSAHAHLKSRHFEWFIRSTITQN